MLLPDASILKGGQETDLCTGRVMRLKGAVKLDSTF